MRTLGNRIREWRLAKGLSQGQLSEGICTPSAISQIENDKIIPNAVLLSKVSIKLGATMNDLLYGGEIEQQLEEVRLLVEAEKLEEALRVLKTIERYDTPEMEHQDTRMTVNFYIGYILLKSNYRDDAIPYLENAYSQIDKENPAYKLQARKTLVLLCRAFGKKRRLANG